MSQKNKRTFFIARFIKFAGVGVIGTIAHYITLVCLVQFFGLNVVLSSSLGAIVGALVNYYLNYHFTFESNKRHADAMTKFFTVATIGFVLNGVLMTLFTQQFTIHYLLAQIVTTGIILIWNFFGNHFWTFSEARNPLIEQVPSINEIEINSAMKVNKNDQTIFSEFNHSAFYILLAISIIYLFWACWWGWPLSFDQHDPTKSAIQMMWHHSLDSGRRYYGAFGYQEVLFFSVIPVKLLEKLSLIDTQLAETLMFQMTRILWALKGLGIIIMTYIASKQLFQDQRAALISMFFMAMAPGFIAWTHIPQLDIVHAFWYTVSVALTIAGWKHSSFKLLLFAAVAAGLAASVKYIGGVVVLAPIAIGFMRFPLKRAFIYGCLLMILALTIFFVTTPLATGSPLQWLPEFTADLLANQHRELEKPIALWTMPIAMWNMVGPGTAILGIIGAILMFFPGRKPQPKQSWWVLFACFIPYYICLSWQHVATVRYVLPFASIIFVLLGRVTSQALERGFFSRPVFICMVLVGLVQVVLTTSLIIGLSTDTRPKLAVWLEQNTEKTDTVETILSHRPFFVDKPKFKVINRPHFQAETYEMKTNIDADKDSTIRKLHNVFTKLAGRNPDKILTWVDKDRKWLKKSVKTYDTSINGPISRQVKYVVMNTNTAQFYILDWPGFDPESPNEKNYIKALFSQAAPFKLAMQFKPVVPDWLRYPRELWFNISPPINVYQVDTGKFH